MELKNQISMFPDDVLSSSTGDMKPPFTAGSATSKKASEQIIPFLRKDRLSVLGWLAAFGPAIDEVIQNALSMRPDTERPRRNELVKAGMVQDSGKVSHTASGREAVMWEVTAHGKAALEIACAAGSSRADVV